MVFVIVDPVAAEVFALALFRDLKQSIPFFPRLSERIALYQNKNFQDFTAVPARDHPCVRHSIKIGLGELPGGILYADVPCTVQDRLNPYIV